VKVREKGEGERKVKVREKWAEKDKKSKLPQGKSVLRI
jgi:hypothetical protein